MRNLETRKGKKVATPFTDEEALDKLNAMVNNGAQCSDFAVSLLTHRHLSPDQMTWVHVLVVGDRPKSAIVDGLDLLAIVALMNKAAVAQKRWPKIVLSGMTLLRKPNAEVLVRNASKQRIAIIDRDGRVHRGTINDAQLKTLDHLARDPKGVAAQHGVATGRCCFCNTMLSTMQSRSVGYGPICANKFGLPWGKISPEVRKLQLEAQLQEATNEAGTDRTK